MNAGELIRNAVDEAIEEAQDDGLRNHLGPSKLSSPCDRAVWYDHRWYSRRYLQARVLRIFDRGNREERVIVGHLRAAGIIVRNVDEDGRQFGFSTFGGHFMGSVDGIIELPKGLAATTGLNGQGLLEIKTMNDKKYRKVTREEAIPISHYDQMQAYMHFRDLKWGLHVAANKNDDHWLYTVVPYSPVQAKHVVERAESILRAKRPPKRLSDTGTYYICRICDHRDVCHRGQEQVVSCRSCRHSRMAEDSLWRCTVMDDAAIDMTERDGERIRMPCEGDQWMEIPDV